MLKELSSFPFGSLPTFGLSCVRMVSIGVIHDWVILPSLPSLFIRGKAKNSIFGSKPLTFVLLALRLDFNITLRMDSELSRECFLVPCV